jgi:hypothetical protein
MRWILRSLEATRAIADFRAHTTAPYNRKGREMPVYSQRMTEGVGPQVDMTPC